MFLLTAQIFLLLMVPYHHYHHHHHQYRHQHHYRHHYFVRSSCVDCTLFSQQFQYLTTVNITPHAVVCLSEVRRVCSTFLQICQTLLLRLTIQLAPIQAKVSPFTPKSFVVYIQVSNVPLYVRILHSCSSIHTHTTQKKHFLTCSIGERVVILELLCIHQHCMWCLQCVLLAYMYVCSLICITSSLGRS